MEALIEDIGPPPFPTSDLDQLLPRVQELLDHYSARWGFSLRASRSRSYVDENGFVFVAVDDVTPGIPARRFVRVIMEAESDLLEEGHERCGLGSFDPVH